MRSLFCCMEREKSMMFGKKPSSSNSVITEEDSSMSTQIEDSRDKRYRRLSLTRRPLPEASAGLDRFAATVADDPIKESERMLVQAAGVAIFLWIILCVVFVAICPEENMEYLEGNSQLAYSTVFSVLLVANLSRLFSLLLKDEGYYYSLKSGFVVASFSAQFISTVTCGMIAYLPTPVLMDAVIGQRVHMLRWAAWAPLAFLMTFLTEGVTLNHRTTGVRDAWVHGFLLFWSTIPGAMFPYIKDATTYAIIYTLAFVCLGDVYHRFFKRRPEFLAIQKGRSAGEILRYHQVRSGFRLLRFCFYVWTFIGFHALLPAAYPHIFPKGSFLLDPSIPSITECMIELTSKIWYLMMVISAYELIFDERARAARRLEEIRSMMLCVWDKSSDIVVISSRARSDAGRVVSMVNPSFVKIQDDTTGENDSRTSFNALVLETHLSAGVSTVSSTEDDTLMAYINLNQPFLAETQPPSSIGPSVSAQSIASLNDVLVAAWQETDGEAIVSCDLIYGGSRTRPKKARCEAKVTKVDDGTIMVVISDITERIRRFEAEKLAVAEATARKKDAQANRFTKHEVKNGILAAIGLCENLLDSDRSKALATQSSQSSADFSSRKELTELDVTLREVLDTVLAEAMARDVVHECYEPSLELINAQKVLTGYRFSHDPENPSSDAHSKRFPFKTTPQNLPRFFLDSQLLRYIHRNAVSNACRYGEPGGQVLTELEYDDQSKKFEMRVINLPGPEHTSLLELKDAASVVFSPGRSLHADFSTDDEERPRRLMKHSTGDGAWIMKKCAKMLKGDCSIAFEPSRTVFTFSCPAEAFHKKNEHAFSFENDDDFEIPPGTWGIAIDDSGIQRKILGRFLHLLGIPKQRSCIVGQNAEEILNFKSLVERIVEEHPDDKVLIIADENLDMEHGQIVSGSLSCQHILESLGKHADRVLALVRSANDSKEDSDLYASRTHGSIPKNPLGNKAKMTALIKPHWMKRFPATTRSAERRNSFDSAGYSHGDDSSDPESILVEESFDIMKIVERLDELCQTPTDALLESRWPSIWEKLHMLKGDILAMYGREITEAIVKAISKLRGHRLPHDFENQWREIRSLVIQISSQPYQRRRTRPTVLIASVSA